jgi:signal transduction histidine kinase/DNA-binding response OmpR family regulator
MADAEKVNILVVDDLPEKILAMELILAELGQNVVPARSGREALRHLLHQDFAVILLDVSMPEMDGFDTARLIRQRKRSEHTPIIFVTGFSDELLAARGYSLGAVDYILSPVVPEVLRTKVGVFVELYQKTEQVRRQAEQQVALAREQLARASAEDANRRSAYLAEASKVLANSLDVRATARGLLRVAVPYLADAAGVTLPEEPGQPWLSELAWVPPGGTDLETFSLTAPDGPSDEVRAALERVLASGQAQALEGIDATYPPAAAGEPAGRLRSAVVLPLLARGRTLGALTLGCAGHRLCPPDLGLAEDLAQRAAVALDNARLHREVQENDRRKNEFLAMLAHELRNPLAPIRNAVGILRRYEASDPTQDWSREVIDRQVRQMTRLIDDLLDVSRITQGKIKLKRERVDLLAVVGRAVETSRPLIDERRHELTVSLPPGPVPADADPARVEQVLANLLNNAAKYTEPGGRIDLTGELGDGGLTLRVRDTGVGIAPEMLAGVFEMFTQVDRSLDRAQGGLGIGLTLVKTLVELHGGRVEAHSGGPGRGSEFTVRLPVAPAGEGTPEGPREDAPAAVPHPSPRTARRVLVVDDNADGANALAHVLRLTGHEVRVAHTGPGALSEAEAFRPGTVLLDIGLPGMDGYAVARELGERLRPDRPLLVALTGYGRDEDRRRSREAGFDHHLVKPVDPAALLALLGTGGALGPNGQGEPAGRHHPIG